MNKTIDIKTTDNQILIQTDSVPEYSGYSKNSIRYSSTDTSVRFYLKGNSSLLCWSEWQNVTVNGEILAKDNYQELLEALFI